MAPLTPDGDTMGKTKGLEAFDFLQMIRPEYRTNPHTAEFSRDHAYLISLQLASFPNGGRWPWARKGKQEMDIVVDANGKWRLCKAA